MIRLMLVDDQPHVRQGLRMRLALEPDVAVVGEAGDGAEAVTLAETEQPDVVVMDVVMPVMDGFAATEALQSRLPRTAVVIHSLYDDAKTKSRASAVGATAFVCKCDPAESLLTAIRQAVQGAGPVH